MFATVQFTTECVRNLDKLILVKLYYGGTVAPAASKKNARFKSGQKRFKNNHLDLLVQISHTLCSYDYFYKGSPQQSTLN